MPGSLRGGALRDGIEELLETISRKGVLLWQDNGRLRYKAPKGALTPEELARLTSSKEPMG